MSKNFKIASDDFWSFDKSDLQRSYSGALKKLALDEHQETKRYGEYGKAVSAATRQSSIFPATPSPNRTNAFYTFCALEFYAMYGGPEFTPMIERIVSFTRNRLEHGAFFTARSHDGYQAGSFEPHSGIQLNYRHTFILAQVLALMELDKLTLVSVREHLLSDKAQHDSGGWLIWGNDQTAGSDIICSCHALIMLQYFRARAQSESDYHLFDMKINRTVDYFLFQRNDRKLWSSPSGDGHDSLQMSAWYFVVLLPFLIEAHPNEVGHTYESLCVWLKPDKQASLEASMMGREIQVRLIYAALVASQLGYQQFDSDAYQVFQNILKDEREIEGLTTYALTRYLILLREFLRVHDSSMSVSKFVLGRVLAMPFPLTDWLRWGIETKQEWARLQRLVD